MFAKGPVPGNNFKTEALKLLPPGTVCRRVSAVGLTGYIVELPGRVQIASAGSPGLAWRGALDWASRNRDRVEELRDGR
jgi:hypothetical protein